MKPNPELKYSGEVIKTYYTFPRLLATAVMVGIMAASYDEIFKVLDGANEQQTKVITSPTGQKAHQIKAEGADPKSHNRTISSHQTISVPVSHGNDHKHKKVEPKVQHKQKPKHHPQSKHAQPKPAPARKKIHGTYT